MKYNNIRHILSYTNGWQIIPLCSQNVSFQSQHEPEAYNSGHMLETWWMSLQGSYVLFSSTDMNQQYANCTTELSGTKSPTWTYFIIHNIWYRDSALNLPCLLMGVAVSFCLTLTSTMYRCHLWLFWMCCHCVNIPFIIFTCFDRCIFFNIGLLWRPSAHCFLFYVNMPDSGNSMVKTVG